MKKSLLLLSLWFGIVTKILCQPQISNVSFPSSVPLFDLFEISFNLNNSYVNPYDPNIIAVRAEFTAPDNSTRIIEGFYYEDYTFQMLSGHEVATHHPNNDGWRIRFTPDQIGTWNFRIYATDANGNTIIPNFTSRSYRFTCTSVSNAKGFITTANSRFLKRDIVKNGQREYHSYFPIGPNIASYSNNGSPLYPLGIYYYERLIDSLNGNGNYMRIFFNRYQHLSLYGPEYTQMSGGYPTVYFDSSVNQKDAAELDYIINYSKEHDISITACIFNYLDFCDINIQDPSDVSIWSNNPYNTILGLDCSCDFFIDENAIRITKQLLRYIVARWGYATNIMMWEFWNEVDKMFKMCDGYKSIEQDVLSWHEEMVKYIRRCDAYNHLISTSLGKPDTYRELFLSIFEPMDIVQQHNYQNIQKAKSAEQISNVLYNISTSVHNDYPSKPFFMGEFGFGNGNSELIQKDPYGFDLHNSLWSSFFSSAMGSASQWWWPYLLTKDLFRYHQPILNFSNNLPILSESFTAHQTGTTIDNRILEFPNNLETYYLSNLTEDTIMGWCQDTAFCYQSLRWLTDNVYAPSNPDGNPWHFIDNDVFDSVGYVYTNDPIRRPHPSSNSNLIKIPIINQPIGTSYLVQFFDSETGLPYSSIGSIAYVQQNSDGTKYVSFSFPSSIRNLRTNRITNMFGDMVFLLRFSGNMDINSCDEIRVDNN